MTNQIRINDRAPASVARYTLPADGLRALETAWGGVLPGQFHFDWSEDTPASERERREQQARSDLERAGVLVRDAAGDWRPESHLGRFLDIARQPTTVASATAWDRDQQLMVELVCGPAFGLALTRRRFRLDDCGDGAGRQAWGDEDSITVTLGRRSTVLSLPLDLLDEVRPAGGERLSESTPATLRLADSVALVQAIRASERPDLVDAMLERTGSPSSGEPWRSLAAGIEAGFHVVLRAPGQRSWFGLWLLAGGLWLSLGADIASVRRDPAASTAPVTGPDLVDDSRVRLTATTWGGIIAAYLMCAASLEQEA